MSRLISITARRSWGWAPAMLAMCASAFTSFGKQEPPYPTPASRNSGLMRRSRPMPRETSLTSAPRRSQMLAISLMKLILVARNALDAYLIISAVRMSVWMIGGSGCRSRYTRATQSIAWESVPPSTTRSG